MRPSPFENSPVRGDLEKKGRERHSSPIEGSTVYDGVVALEHKSVNRIKIETLGSDPSQEQ
jgi:hypothetical protein